MLLEFILNTEPINDDLKFMSILNDFIFKEVCEKD